MRREIILSLSEIHILMRSNIPLDVGSVLTSFCMEDRQPDYIFDIEETECMPKLPDKKIGEDLLQEYYEADGECYAVAKAGTAGLLVVTRYRSDFSKMTMYVKANRKQNLFSTFEKAFQLFPIRELLVKEGAVMLHSSQIVVKQKGILFTAPSGTGKTTQARLWEQSEDAEVVCNDRTLLRIQDNVVFTYGYPIDGSSPVNSIAKNRLGAIVVLRQSTDNHIERLSVTKALKYLMEQTVVDIWNQREKNDIIKIWFAVLEKYPVYRLCCRPDGGAVECMKKLLEREGVI